MDKLGPYLLGPNDENQGIYTGDARDLAQAIPDESVDIIFTSPPYNVKLGYVGFDDNQSREVFLAFNQDWLLEAFRITHDTGRLYVVVGDKMLWWFRDMAINTGWKYVQTLTWCKPNFVGAGGIQLDWDHMTEHILLFRKGKRVPMLKGGYTTHNWFVETTPQRNFKEGRIHPAQWPIGLCLRILTRTPGNVVLDLFAGSASALVAAKMLGRFFIGFEIVPDTADLARKRVRETQPPLFMPQAEQMPMELSA